jgi:hypothetical protein
MNLQMISIVYHKKIDNKDGEGKRPDCLTFLMGFTGQKWQMFTSVTKVCLRLINIKITI